MCKPHSGWFRDSSPFEVAMSYVHQAVKESSSSEDYCFCVNLYSEVGFYSADAIIFYNYFIYSILQKRYILYRFELTTPFATEDHAVALCARAPHCRTFRHIEHPELYHCLVGNNSRKSAKCIYLPDNLTFGNSTHSGVARHLCDFVHVDCHEQHFASHICRCRCRFAACVSSTYYYNIVIFSHLISITIYPIQIVKCSE